MRILGDYRTTVNRRVFSRSYKEALGRKLGLCSRCPFHKSDNHTRKDKRNWKRYRLNRWKEAI